MKVALLTQSYPPMVSGAALVTQRLAESLATRHHAVLVLAASETIYPYSQRESGVQVIRLKSTPNPMRVKQRFILWSHSEIAREIESFQPDILHMHDCLNMGLVGVKVCQALSIPAVLTVHQLPWFILASLPIPTPLKRSVENCLWAYGSWLLNQCQEVIVPSARIANIISDRIQIQSWVIHNGVDLGHFSPIPAYAGEFHHLCRKYGLDPGHPIILHVGRIDPDKRVDLVIRAAARAMESTKTQLLVVGDGTGRAKLIEMCADLGIAHNSRFPGYVDSGGDLPGLYRLGSVFITASEIEVQSSVVLEAAATGLPVIATDSSSMAELVDSGNSGYLVRPRDIDGMAFYLEYLLKNPDISALLGRQGRAIARQFAIPRSILAHENIYREVQLGISARERLEIADFKQI